MAIGDIYVFGKTDANVNADVLVETTGRINGDNILKNDILANIVGSIENTNTQILETQVPILQSQLTSAVNQRKAKFGDPAIETVAGGVTFSAKFNQVKARTLDDENLALSSGSDVGLIVTTFEAAQLRNSDNEMLINDMIAGSPAYDSLKEAETFITDMKTGDDNTIAGFTTNNNAIINDLAMGGQQTKTNGMIYRDEILDKYYRLYINNGSLNILEVNASGNIS